MRTLSTSHEYAYPWQQVVTAFWHRYPNPYATHVLSEDTVVRRIEDGNLISKRLTTKKGYVPSWGQRFLPGGKAYIVEESVVDPKNKTFTTYTRNVDMTRLVEEKCVYRPSPGNEDYTICEREGYISSNVMGASRALKKLGVGRLEKGMQKTVLGYEWVLNRMYSSSADPCLKQTSAKQKLNGQAGKIKSTAQKAKDIAKSKATLVIAQNAAQCSPAVNQP